MEHGLLSTLLTVCDRMGMALKANAAIVHICLPEQNRDVRSEWQVAKSEGSLNGKVTMRSIEVM